MDVQTLSTGGLGDFSGAPVRLELCGNEPPVCGNVYTIDPLTRSVVLAQFAAPAAPARLVWVPGSSIKLLHPLDAAELPAGCLPSSKEALEAIDRTIDGEQAANSTADDEAAISQRRDRLLEFLRSKHVPFTEQPDGTLQIGPVRIAPPYTRENCLSENVMALNRTQTMLADILI